MAEPEVFYTNLVLSHNPCPICVQAGDERPMTEQEWRDSEYGLPGSDGRYCGDCCHCLLVEAGTDISELLIGNDKLRGDEESDVRKIIELGPREQALKDLMEEWYARGNRVLPPEIYDMEFGEIAPYLKKLMGK